MLFAFACARRSVHTESWEEHTLNRWIFAKEKRLQLRNAIPTALRLEALHHILPTRKQNDFFPREAFPSNAPKQGDIIHPGHHLVKSPFHPDTPLRPDGSSAVQAPPPPWTRRMWTGGKIHFAPQPLVIGLGFVQKRIHVPKKCACSNPSMSLPNPNHVPYSPQYGIQGRLPSVKMLQRIVTMQWHPQRLDLVLEEQETEFFPDRYDPSEVRSTNLIPIQSGILSFAFDASSYLISSFCAVSRESHRIHFDLGYANEEGYPNRVIPVQLQLILILDALGAHLPQGMYVKEIEYQVVNPLFAGHEISIYRHWLQGPSKRETTAWQLDRPNPTKSQRASMKKFAIILWTTDENGIVGVVATIYLRPLPKQDPDRRWKIETEDGHLAYARGPGQDDVEDRLIEEEDRRILSDTLASSDSPQGRKNSQGLILPRFPALF